jgi:hypothetical protein
MRRPMTGATREEREAIRAQLRAGCARCGRHFNDPGLGRGYGAAWQSGDGAIHYPACATREESADVNRRLEALRKGDAR